MAFAVEVIVTANPNVTASAAMPVRRLPHRYQTISAARMAGANFLSLNGAYMASKGPHASIAMFQVVDEGGDIVVAPTLERR